MLGEDERTDNANEMIVSTEASSHEYISFPPFVACQTDKIPTVNQILRRKRQQSAGTLTRKGRSTSNMWEYDYINGRSVPGDGRIDFDKAFPPSFIAHKKVTLDSPHAKQMCWEESGGSFATIYKEVVDQITEYVERGRPNVILGEERTLSILQFEEATESSIQSNVLGARNGRRGVVKNLLSRARGVRDKVLSRRSKRKVPFGEGQDITKRKRFSFGRKRRKGKYF